MLHFDICLSQLVNIWWKVLFVVVLSNSSSRHETSKIGANSGKMIWTVCNKWNVKITDLLVQQQNRRIIYRRHIFLFTKWFNKIKFTEFLKKILRNRNIIKGIYNVLCSMICQNYRVCYMIIRFNDLAPVLLIKWEIIFSLSLSLPLSLSVYLSLVLVVFDGWVHECQVSDV